jgi:uncharacterized damage-inducible protein DinB
MQDKSIYLKAPSYYHYYFDLISTSDLRVELIKNKQEAGEFIQAIPEEKLHTTYAEGKWTVAEVLRHIIETERIFSYRAMRLSRFDHTALPGFDENEYIANLQEVIFSKEQLLREFHAVREATMSLFETMTRPMLEFEGNANGNAVTAEMLGFMIAGHTQHHLNVLRERY